VSPPPLAGTGGGHGSPGTAAPELDPEECEGDEYTITVSFEIGEEGVETQASILIQRIAGDGSESELELELEGSLSDVRALVDLLSSEGNCVQLVFEPVLGPDVG
ncbi:MAG TPA: hypothetical protein VFJ99_02980, partial [Solirubrobacterales bacterium]|nr:hypothetical protein [Solirubrobacterales bacterium]